MTNQLTSNDCSESNENKVKNLFLIKFAEMRAKGPSSNFMSCQRFIWAVIYLIPFLPPAMKLIIGEQMQFHHGTTEQLILVVCIFGFRLLALGAISVINTLYQDKWLTEAVYKRWIYCLLFEGTLFGILLFGKKRFFKDHTIILGQ